MSIEERLERLERQKWMRRLGAAGVALVVAVFLMGQGKKPPDLVVRSLRLTDAAGRTRAELGVRGGVSALTLKDEAGRPRVRLVAGKTVSEVILRGAKDPKPRILLASSFAGGGPYISLYDKALVPRIFLAVDEDGSPSLSTVDKNGVNRATFGVTHTRETKTAESTLTLRDAKGKVIWQAPKE